MQSDYHSFLKGEKKISEIAECFKRKFNEIDRKKAGPFYWQLRLKAFLGWNMMKC